MMKKSLFVLTAVFLFLSLSASAQATIYTLPATDVWGANFLIFDANKAGRGVFPTFLATQGDKGNEPGVDKGYNTDYRPVQYNETNSAQHNYILQLDWLLNNNGYYSFALDADQAPGQSSLIAMTKFQIFQTNNQYIHDYNPTLRSGRGGFADAVNVYDLDHPGNSNNNNTILIDYLTSSGGSGWSDMIADIPVGLFSDSYQYVVLFAEFAGDNDGPQEWSYLYNPASVPEPATMLLLGSGLLGLAGFGRKKIFSK